MFKNVLKSAVLLTLLAAATTAASADIVVFDRGLPTANLNNSAGANRSNVSWGFGAWTPTYYSGDDFTLGGAGQWNISTVRVWANVGDLGSLTALEDRFSSISLYGGSGPTLVNLMSGATTGNSTNNSNISITAVTYAGGANYQGTGGTFSNIFQIEFNNLDWLVNGGEKQHFSVAGVDKGGQPYSPFFMHASNSALGGAPADGADQLYSAFFDNGANGLVFDGSINSADLGMGWDKSSDINVQIQASVVPEPSSVALFGVALLGFAATRRKRGAQR